jgi:hypothetical protein
VHATLGFGLGLLQMADVADGLQVLQIIRSTFRLRGNVINLTGQGHTTGRLAHLAQTCITR